MLVQLSQLLSKTPHAQFSMTLKRFRTDFFRNGKPYIHALTELFRNWYNYWQPISPLQGLPSTIALLRGFVVKCHYGHADVIQCHGGYPCMTADQSLDHLDSRSGMISYEVCIR